MLVWRLLLLLLYLHVQSARHGLYVQTYTHVIFSDCPIRKIHKMARMTIEERGRAKGMLNAGVPLRVVSIISIDIPEVETFYDIYLISESPTYFRFLFRWLKFSITVRAFDFFGFDKKKLLKVSD